MNYYYKNNDHLKKFLLILLYGYSSAHPLGPMGIINLHFVRTLIFSNMGAYSPLCLIRASNASLWAASLSKDTLPLVSPSRPSSPRDDNLYVIKNYVCDQRLNLPTYTEISLYYLIQLFGNLLYILCCLECVSDVSFLSFQSTLIKVAEPCISIWLLISSSPLKTKELESKLIRIVHTHSLRKG